MKKRLFALCALCLALTGCAGLPAAREMGDMALLRTLGVDAAPAGVAVTGSTGPRAKGLQAEGEEALVLTADQDSLSGACLAMQGRSDSSVFFGYVDQLLVGEELAREGVQPVLDYFSRDTQLGLGARLWLVRDASARDAVSSGGEEGAVSRLETLQTDGRIGIASLSRTAGEVYTDLLELGCTFVPALSPTGDEVQIFKERGYAVLKGDTLAGWLEGEAARGLELLTGGPASHIITLELPGNKVSVRITSACTKSELEFQGNGLSALKLTCKIEAQLSEYEAPLTEEELSRLRNLVAEQEHGRMESALDHLRALQADCIGLGAKAAMACPAQWQKVQADWPEWFSEIPIEVTVHIKLNT